MDDTQSFRVSFIHSHAVIGPPSLTVVKNPPSSKGVKPRSCSPSSFSSGFVDLQLSNRRPPNHCSQLPDPLFSTLNLTHPRSKNCSDSIPEDLHFRF
ncbi:hypothetical protein ABKV19_018994 [Rosa sericea]